MARGANTRLMVFSCALLLLAGAFFSVPERVSASEDIRRQINEKNDEIKRLEADAKRYQAEIVESEKSANTLQGQIRIIDQTIRRLDAEIKVTDAKIVRATLEIRALGTEIGETEDAIAVDRVRLAALVRELAERDQEPPLATFMKYDSLSAFFTVLDELAAVQGELHRVIVDLRVSRAELADQKGRTEAKRAELAELARDLADQKSIQAGERKARATLLAETRNQEKRYQQLLADAKKKREALETEIEALEATLRATFDRSLLPKAGDGVLGWPLPEPIVVTQNFGNTEFARGGAYGGKGHNGADFRAANGTAVFAAERGTVRAAGDTDLGCRRVSYGKWILIDHPNNLSTLYAHLSLAKVSAGDTVNRGTLIAYSGATGYATGPHLHFTVFAREAVEVIDYRSKVCGTIMKLPISPNSGYLNPLDYL